MKQIAKWSSIPLSLFAASFFATDVAAQTQDQNKAIYRNEIYRTQPIYPVYKGEPVRRPCCGVEGLRDGLYVGLGVGYDAYKVRTSISEEDILGGLIQTNPELIGKGLDASIFAGYGLHFDWFYLGGEFFAKTSDATTSYNISSSGFNYNTEFNVHSSFGLGLLPGVMVNEKYLIYARIGAVRTSVKTQETGSGGLVGTFSDSDTQWINGLSGGLGLEGLLYEGFSLRGEYLYTSYSSFVSDLGTRYAPSDNEFTLGLLYHFDFA